MTTILAFLLYMYICAHLLLKENSKKTKSNLQDH
jgi:hypothetical protein